MRRLIWATLLALVAPPALAANPTPADQAPTADAPASSADASRSPTEPKGLLSWKTLAQVEEVKQNNRIVPKFSAQITALDSKEVKLQGFMMPLEPGMKQKRFLLSANVPSCPFCMPGGPDSLIEVLCKKPIAFNMEPIIISGRLTVLRDDPTGLWYRLTDAVLEP
ncbi:MAG TPA: DUF3299 domain-containing protein [Burkholderiales bacterium]|nr:DUF3299 domain-containing protein [Burkholderiales bacterium]